MPAVSALTFFLVAASGLILIPGPTVMFILTRSAVQGRRAGLISVAGIELGTIAHTMAATLGLSALLLSSPLAFSVVKWLGTGCLIVIAVRALLRHPSARGAVVARQRFHHVYGQGFLVQLLNPKTVLFFYAFLPQFVDPARAVTGQILVFGSSYALLALCIHSLYALLGSIAGNVLKRNVRFQRGQRYVTGGIYLALALTVVTTGSVIK
jgi:threonine/homoserine/homoserine lactone efflux protein